MPMQTIRILIYTDNEDVLSNSDEEGEGVSIMCRLMCAKLRKIAKVKVTILNRHDPTHGATKLTCDLLKQFDELWVIGFGNAQNGPYELIDDEVYDLAAWMYRGGVMVSGDHSQPQLPRVECNDLPHENMLARGYGLGHRIPRAGQLRVWKGPPTNCKLPLGTPLEKTNTHSTLAKIGQDETSPSEEDKYPQSLEEMRDLHFLFFYDLGPDGQPLKIDFLPDHQHEGDVQPPAAYDKFWPPRPPEPVVVAQGRDHRFPDGSRIYNLIMAYDGDEAGVGRIVADSSFHHFLNLNLREIPEKDACGNPVPGTPRDKIAQFYANLALWLAPVKLRESIRERMFLRASTHITVLEELGNSAEHVGLAMRAALASEVGNANVWRILEAVADDRPAAQLLKNSLSATGPLEQFGGVDADSALGVTALTYHQYFWDNGIDPLNLPADPTPPGFLNEGIEKAFSAQLSSVGGLRAKPADDSEPGGDS